MGTGVAPTLWSPANVPSSDAGDVVDRERNPPLWIALPCLQFVLGVVKPHGRLGPLRSEHVTVLPRAAYRRGSLPRPFRGLKAPGRFILGGASHLDAFSGYHDRPSLPGVAPGGAVGTRAGRPTRSSRTRVRFPQSSNAHDGYRPNCLTTF